MNKQPDFFASYNRADRDWAEWVAWQLEEAGYTTILQAWDFQPGSNFILEMDEAAKRAKRTIAILSPDYLTSTYAAPEWAAAFAQDARGDTRRLIPVRVRRCDLTGLLAPIVYIDLVGLDEDAVRDTLLRGIRQERAKPQQPPHFPGGPAPAVPEEPPFPGDAAVDTMAQPRRTARELSAQSGIDTEELTQRALALIPPANRGYAPGRLGVVAAGGPRRVVVRPAQLESGPLRERLTQRALFGETKLFDLGSGGVDHHIEGNALLLHHHHSAVALDELGSLAVFQPVDLPRPRSGISGGLDSSVLIEEELADRLQRALRFISATLNEIDPQRSLAAVAIAAVLLDVGHRAWRTWDEHRASPNSVSLPMMPEERVIVQLSPPVQARDSLDHEHEAILEDLLVQLRRKVRSR